MAFDAREIAAKDNSWHQHLDYAVALHAGPSVCLCRARIHAIVDNDDERAETCTMFPPA